MKYDRLNFQKTNNCFSKANYWKVVKKLNLKFDYTSIYVVGTNGKGSNVKYVADELILNNKNVGVFTSPHILKVNERIAINNKPISNYMLNKLFKEIKNEFGDINFGWFDILFFIALKYFDNKKVDIVVFEAGIGAKKDIVNFLNHKYVIVTSISKDHTNILGNSLKAIASDKSYAIKKNNICYISDAIKNDLIDIFQQRANKVNANLKIVKTQKNNYETINQSLSKKFLIDEFQIKKFKSNFSLPIGRMQKAIINGFICYFDVSHNIEAFEKTFAYIKDKKITINQIVVSISSDKDKDAIFSFLRKQKYKIYCYQNKGIKPLNIKEYDKDFIRIKNLKKFMQSIDKPTIFIGSFYLLADIYKK